MRLISSLFALFFSVALLVIGNAFLLTLLGTRMSLNGDDPLAIGGMMVAYSIGFVVGTLYAEKIVVRAGHIRAFAVFSALLAIAALCYPMTDALWFWALLRLLGGVMMAGLLIIVESWFSAIATNANRATLFSLYQMCFYLATTVGQFLVALGDPGHFFLFSISAILLIASLIPLGLTRLQAPLIEHGAKASLKDVWQVAPLGVLAAMCSGMILSSFYGLGPWFANANGLSIDAIAWFMGMAVLLALASSWPVGWLCDRLNRAKMLMVLAAVAGVVSLLMQLRGAPVVYLVVVNAVLIALAANIYPIGVALTNDRMPSEKLVAAAATLLLSFGIGSCIGPALFAGLISALGPVGLYLGTTVTLLSLAAYAKYRMGRGLTVDVAHQEPFVPTAPNVSQVIQELHPANPSFEEVPDRQLMGAGEPKDQRSP